MVLILTTALGDVWLDALVHLMTLTGIILLGAVLVIVLLSLISGLIIIHVLVCRYVPVLLISTPIIILANVCITVVRALLLILLPECVYKRVLAHTMVDRLILGVWLDVNLVNLLIICWGFVYPNARLILYSMEIPILIIVQSNVRILRTALVIH